MKRKISASGTREYRRRIRISLKKKSFPVAWMKWCDSFMGRSFAGGECVSGRDVDLRADRGVLDRLRHVDLEQLLSHLRRLLVGAHQQGCQRIQRARDVSGALGDSWYHTLVSSPIGMILTPLR